MDKRKNIKNYGTAYYAMAFLVAFFFEFYWIMTSPYDYFMLLGVGVIMIITGYLTIDSILKARADSEAKKDEQNDMMLKAQKAIYIATKKNAKDAELRQAQSVKAVELMMNKMISSQQALLEEKKTDDSDMTSLIDQLSASNAKLAKEVQSAITVNQLVKANADLVKNVKEALNASALSSVNTTADLSSYVAAAVAEPVIAPQPAVVPEPVVPELVITPEPAITPDPIMFSEASPNLEALFDSEPLITTMAEPEAIADTEVIENAALDLSLNEFDLSEMPSLDSLEDITSDSVGIDEATMNEMEAEINMASMAESEALEAITIPDEMTPELDLAMDDGSDSPEIAMEESSSNEETDNTGNAVANPFTAKVDDSPNRQLTEEEIAALFASL